MKHARIHWAGWLFLTGLLVSSGLAEGPFVHDVQTPAKPWTHINFKNDPNDFQFALVSDRTDGHREGVFPSAVRKLNLLQPEFVLSVGDLIEGYKEDPEVLKAMWDEFDGFVQKFEMPFFYVAGNHDISNAIMAKLWEERQGRRYYWFLYKDVLFLCLDSQDAPVRDGVSPTEGGLGEEQIRWAKKVLAEHKDVRWTFVLMHQPLWAYEEGHITSARKEITKPRNTGFAEIEKALTGRKYTVIAGHWHQYVKFIRHKQNYFILASTGGGSQLRGPAFGEFDHAVWVTMTPTGPRIANLLLKGILDDAVYTEAMLRFQNLRFADVKESNDGRKLTFALSITNPYRHPMHVSLHWNQPTEPAWRITSTPTEAKILPDKTANFTFEADRIDGGTELPLPVCEIQYAAGKDMESIVIPLPVDVDAFLRAHRPTLTVRRAEAPPKIDSQLDDAAWRRTADVTAFQDWKLRGKPDVPTEAWVAFDDIYYYVAMRCCEPDMAHLSSRPCERDALSPNSDYVDIFLQPDPEGETYYQFLINPHGSLYDAMGWDKSFDADGVLLATERNENDWTVELAVPWKDLHTPPTGEDAIMGFLLSRVRHKHGMQVMQYPPLNGGNHRHELYGRLQFEK